MIFKHFPFIRLTCLAILACVTLSGCAAQQGVQTYPVQDDARAYVLGTGDTVQITVFDQPSLSGQFKVEPTGKISFPLIEEVDASGYTVDELTQALAAKLSPQYVVDPKISAEVIAYRNVYILGEVQAPGKYEYAPNMTVLQAIAMAGGYTYRADEGGARVTRHVKGALKTFPVNNQTMIKPGDTIQVSRRWF